MNISVSPIITCLEEMQADNIVSLDMPAESSLCDNMIVCTARSSTHARALAMALREYLKSVSSSVKIEGDDVGEWILVDSINVIIHIMQETTRQLYSLESLWSSKPQ